MPRRCTRFRTDADYAKDQQWYAARIETYRAGRQAKSKLTCNDCLWNDAGCCVNPRSSYYLHDIGYKCPECGEELFDVKARLDSATCLRCGRQWNSLRQWLDDIELSIIPSEHQVERWKKDDYNWHDGTQWRHSPEASKPAPA